MTVRKLTRQDLHEAAEKYKNWGKWGPADEIGTLNYVRPEDIVAAARLVRKGEVISLALNFDERGQQGAKEPLSGHGRISPLPTPCCAPAPTPIRACSTTAASAPPTTWW
jgi:hypothetical protein